MMTQNSNCKYRQKKYQRGKNDWIACQPANYKNDMQMVHVIHHWHVSGSIVSIDSLDMSQWAKVVKTVSSWSIGMPIDSLAYLSIGHNIYKEGLHAVRTLYQHKIERACASQSGCTIILASSIYSGYYYSSSVPRWNPTILDTSWPWPTARLPAIQPLVALFNLIMNSLGAGISLLVTFKQLL